MTHPFSERTRAVSRLLTGSGLALLLAACGGGLDDSAGAAAAGDRAQAERAEADASGDASAEASRQTAGATTDPSIELTQPNPNAAVLAAQATELTEMQQAAAVTQDEDLRQRQSFEAAAGPSDIPATGAGAALPANTDTAAPNMQALAVPALNSGSLITVRARGALAGGLGPVMQVRRNGALIGQVEVRSTDWANYAFPAPSLANGERIEVIYTNDGTVNGQDRNLYVASVAAQGATLLTSAPGVVYDRGAGSAAYDGQDLLPGQNVMAWNGALRFSWRTAAPSTIDAARQDAARLLMQASFGPTQAEIARAASLGAGQWVAEQLALPAGPTYVAYIESKYAQGDAFRPGGANYNTNWISQHFWKTAITGQDQLRRRMAFALHQMLTVSQMDSNLWLHARAYGAYLDTLHRNAFGNYRTLLEQVALSPAMGIYLSHLRNRKEDPATNRLPDENFAREIMQLFTIGLHELNLDGTPKLGANGQPIETYSNADVMALAKVFTGWGWGFADHQLTEQNFRWGTPSYKAASDTRVDLQPMKAYPGQHSTAEKRLFASKPHAVTIPANGTAAADLKLALDALFNHPNVGPFVSRQLIQRMVTSHPSPAYVARVAGVFNNNGSGVRGDLKAVVRAILLDPEARNPSPPAEFGKLREPILRTAHWMRAFGATSTSGSFDIPWALDSLGQRANHAPSVFNFFRPGYIPPGTSFASRQAPAPEMQLVDEASTASWVNLVQQMTNRGIGWTGSAEEIRAAYTTETSLAATGQLQPLVEHLNLLLLGGRMSSTLKQTLNDALSEVPTSNADAHQQRARLATMLVMASPEFLVQR